MKIQNFKFLVSAFILTSCFLNSAFLAQSHALDLEKPKAYFLAGNYNAAIEEGERALSSTREDAPGLDELYYILGLSYLKDGRYLRASDIFEIVLKEFKDSKFSDEAKMGLGDSYFLRGDYPAAQGHYLELLKNSPMVSLRPLVYYRLSLCAAKLGDTQGAKDYLDQLRQDAPLNLETKLAEFPQPAQAEVYYTVQVGTFSKKANADNFKDKLIKEGYPAYIEETNLQDKISYRVRIGKMRLRQEALDLEQKLSRQGYPTKIFP